MEISYVSVPGNVDGYAKRKKLAVVILGTKECMPGNTNSIVSKMESAFPGRDDMKCYVAIISNEDQKFIDGLKKIFGTSDIPVIIVYRDGERRCIPVETAEENLNKIIEGVI